MSKADARSISAVEPDLCSFQRRSVCHVLLARSDQTSRAPVLGIARSADRASGRQGARQVGDRSLRIELDIQDTGRHRRAHVLEKFLKSRFSD